jgi:Leucine-rich repeat (LRR) protein
MKSNPALTAAHDAIREILPTGAFPWQAGANIISQVVAKGCPVQTVLTAVWRDAPAQQFRRVSLPVVLVVKDVSGKPVGGKLATLELDLLECSEPQAPTGYVPSWEMHDLPADEDFRNSFDAARAAINQLDPARKLWPDGAAWVVRWHLRGVNHATLDGKSLGGAVAIGLLALLNLAGKIPAEHCHSYKLRSVTAEQIRATAITAEVATNGHLERIEYLEDKREAAKTRAVKAFFTGGLQRLSASSRPGDPIHVTNLIELLGFLRELEKRSILPNKHGKKGFWLATMSVLLVAVGFLWWWYFDHLRHPTLEQLSERLAGYAKVLRTDNDSYEDNDLDLSEPAHLVEIEDLNEEEWVHVIQPILAQTHERIALRFKGGTEEYVGQPFGLHNLAEIRHLVSLELIRAPISDISGARRLPMLERLVVIGSPVKNLEWVGKLETLKQLCLDSGHIERMPLALSLSQLKEAYLHFPDRSWDVNPKGTAIDEDSRDDTVFANANSKAIAIKGANLQRLWIGGDKIEEIRLIGLDSLKELWILAPSLNPSEFNLGYNTQCLEKLDLRCERLTEILLGSHTALKRLKLMSPKLKKLGNLPASLCTLDLSCCPLDVTHLTFLQRLGELRHLFLESTLIKELPDLRELHKLRWLNLEKTPFDTWPRLSSLAGGCFLQVEHTPIGAKHDEAFKKAEAFVAEWIPGKHEPNDKWLHFTAAGVFDTEFETAMCDGGDYMLGVDSDAHIHGGKESYFDQHPKFLCKFDGNGSDWSTFDWKLVGKEEVFELRADRDNSGEETESEVKKDGTHTFNGWKGGFVGPQMSGHYWLDRESSRVAEDYDIYDLDAW